MVVIDRKSSSIRRIDLEIHFGFQSTQCHLCCIISSSRFFGGIESTLPNPGFFPSVSDLSCESTPWSFSNTSVFRFFSIRDDGSGKNPPSPHRKIEIQKGLMMKKPQEPKPQAMQEPKPPRHLCKSFEKKLYSRTHRKVLNVLKCCSGSSLFESKSFATPKLGS
ncbi:hypothetical protein EPI10_011545 [Gossypium australe]|uniref:Uncharacterized protein n=1 Tax=Gossypium australe TaxID=47621 RepID=A0A5B6W7K1_9ROSI|nr:hypothetical protein EPI10_011545 [Gossypium australe]